MRKERKYVLGVDFDLSYLYHLNNSIGEQNMYVKTDDGKAFVVDTKTGEVLAEYVTTATNTVKEENKHFDASTLNPNVARNKDEIEAFIQATVDKRKLITINNVRHYHDINCGEVRRSGSEDHFTVPSYKLMVKLVKNLTIHNCFIGTTEELSKILDCGVNKISRTLQACKSLVRYQGVKGMQKGFIKLFVSPAYGWKGDATTAYQSQQRAISEWYKSGVDLIGDIAVSAEAPKPFEIEEDFDKWLVSFAKGVKGSSDGVYEEQAEAYYFKQ